MRSQLCFLMHPDDERAFVDQVLEEKGVVLFRASSPRGLPPDTVRTIGEVDDWISAIYFDGDAVDDAIQFLHSRMVNAVLSEGRIAISTETPSVVARYKRLVRWLKKHYRNKQILWRTLGPYRPEAMTRLQEPSKTLWLGDAAIRWLEADDTRRAKQDPNNKVVWGELRPDHVMIGPKLVPRSDWDARRPR